MKDYKHKNRRLGWADCLSCDLSFCGQRIESWFFKGQDERLGNGRKTEEIWCQEMNTMMDVGTLYD